VSSHQGVSTDRVKKWYSVLQIDRYICMRFTETFVLFFERGAC